jgi:Na+/H+ antiporter NhaD/arsenite permease-like protein
MPTLSRILGCLGSLLAVLLWSGDLHASSGNLGQTVSLAWVLPFAGLLICIAVLPLVMPHRWEHNGVKAVVALGCGLPVAIYVGLVDLNAVLHELHEYVSFIVLLGSLFTISGGLVLRGDIKATPGVNTIFLGVGAVLANFVGTTGASMLLIRPVLRTNSQRKHTRHLPVFFIFLVSNIGGALTPLGDPPLFLGFLRGVPFFWTLRLLPLWALAGGLVLLIFYLWDRRAYGQESAADLQRDESALVPLSLAGKLNLLLLAGVIGAVFLPTPWREIGMAAMAVISVVTTPRELRKENGFSYDPIIEVAVLFLGIFLAMIPALAILQARGGELGLTRPWQFFWVTGALSSFLDNAPTYLTFLSLGQSLKLPADVVGVPNTLLLAVSAGAVFMGANTYIGNGPNFMVKAIADRTGIKAPSFFGYMAYAMMILIPCFVVVTLVFFPPWR